MLKILRKSYASLEYIPMYHIPIRLNASGTSVFKAVASQISTSSLSPYLHIYIFTSSFFLIFPVTDFDDQVCSTPCHKGLLLVYRHRWSTLQIVFMEKTRMYGLLYGPSSSSCRGLQPSTQGLFSLWAKNPQNLHSLGI